MSPIAKSAPSRGNLHRILGLSFGIAIAVGGTIGAGIMRAPSSVASHVPSAWAILALWAAGGAIAALGANVYAELSTAIPREGGDYAFAQRAYGDATGLAVGWTYWMSYCCVIAAVSMSFADFLGWITPLSPHAQIAVAAAIQAALYLLNLTGLRAGDLAMKVTSLIKGLALLAFVAVAMIVARHFAAPAVGHAAAAATPATPLSFAGLLAGYQLVDGAYAGWNDPTVFAEENSDPGRTLPRALFSGVAIVALLYLAVVAALLLLLGGTGLAATDLPFSTVMRAWMGPAAGIVVAGFAMLIVVNCANSGVMGAPRVLYALAQDGLLPAALLTTNRGGTPSVGLLMTAIGSLALTLSGSFDIVFGLIATLGAAIGIFSYSAVFVLRVREPDLPRPYRAWGYPWLPLLVLLIAIASFLLYMDANRTGALYALALWLACIPMAWFARRSRPMLARA